MKKPLLPDSFIQLVWMHSEPDHSIKESLCFIATSLGFSSDDDFVALRRWLDANRDIDFVKLNGPHLETLLKAAKAKRGDVSTEQ